MFSSEEKELIINYIQNKIECFKQMCIYGNDITIYEKMMENIKSDKQMREQFLFELYDLITNREYFDKIHNPLHKSIIKKIENTSTYKASVVRYEKSNRKYVIAQRRKQCKSLVK